MEGLVAEGTEEGYLGFLAAAPQFSAYPLTQCLEDWCHNYMQSGWTDRTLSLGYSLRASPSIWGSQGDETLLRDKFPLCGGSGPAAVKQAKSAAPLHNRQKGFYPPYLLVPKKTGEFRPILDLCLLKVLCPQNVHHANHQAVT